MQGNNSSIEILYKTLLEAFQKFPRDLKLKLYDEIDYNDNDDRVINVLVISFESRKIVW